MTNNTRQLIAKILDESQIALKKGQSSDLTYFEIIEKLIFLVLDKLDEQFYETPEQHEQS